jgi:hypothetical protein
MSRGPGVAVARAAAFGLALLVGGCAPEATGPVPPPGSAEGPGLTGVLIDESGGALPFRTVMACTREVCFYSDTNASGRFAFLLDEPIRGVIKTDEDLRSTPRRTSPMVPIAVAANEFLDVGEIVAPSLAGGTPVDANVSEAQTVDAGDGLSLIVSPASIEAAPGRIVEAIAARRLPEHAIPAYAALAGSHVIAVYALHPFAARSATPTGVRIDSDLPEGTRVRLRVIDEIDGTFSDPVPAVVRGGVIATSPGNGITSFTHLVVVGDATD